MDAKQARKLLDEVCADLDRRRSEMSALLGRYARPVGLGLALGLSGVAGCGSDSTRDTALDASPDMVDARPDLPSPQDIYAATMDLYVPPEKKDLGVDYAVDLYGLAMPDAKDVGVGRPVDAYGLTVDVADLRPPAVDIYAAADLPRPDVVDAYGVPNWDAFPRVDAGLDGADKPKLDGGASSDADPVDGGAID